MTEQIVDIVEAGMPVSSDVEAVAKAAGGVAAQAIVAGKIDKAGVGQISMQNLSQEVKLAMTGGSVPVVGANSITSEQLRDGAVHNDKIPLGELTGDRLSAWSGVDLNRVGADADDVLDMRNAIVMKIDGKSQNNTCEVLGPDMVAVTPGKGDTSMVLRIPIIGKPQHLRTLCQIVPAPDGFKKGTRLDLNLSLQTWDKPSGSDIKTNMMRLVSAKYSVEEAYACHDVVAAGEQNYLIVDMPVTASEAGRRFLFRLAAVTSNTLGLAPKRGVSYDMVRPARIKGVTCLYEPINSTSFRVRGDSVRFTVGSSRGGVSTRAEMHRYLDRAYRYVAVTITTDKKVEASPLTNPSSGLNEMWRMREVFAPGTHTRYFDLNEIAAHGDGQLDRIWVTATEPGDYEITMSVDQVQSTDEDANLTDTISRLETLATKPHEEQPLVSPDGTRWRLTVSDDGTLVPQRLSQVIRRVHVIGNSLTILGSTGWNCGMAAPSPETDWYWLTYQHLKVVNSAVVCHCWDDEDKSGDTMTRTNGYAFEQSAEDNSISVMVNTIPTDADLVILQMGDNVNTDERRRKFNASVIDFAKAIRTRAPHAVIVWLGIWFNQPAIVSRIAEAMQVVGGWYVPISDLCQPANMSSVGSVCVWPDHTSHTIDSVGVAQHPGGNGMKAIADRLWQTLQTIATSPQQGAE